ncbi:hypothetical protein D3C76_1255980 [compost metagenome]
MLHRQGMQQLLTCIELATDLGIGQPPTRSQMVAQLANQHRGRAFAVIADAAPDPADIQLVTGRKQRFEQQVTVVLTPRTITRTVVTAHQVEVQRRLRAWVVTIIHAKQADHFERYGAHGHQRTEIHRTGQESL